MTEFMPNNKLDEFVSFLDSIGFTNVKVHEDLIGVHSTTKFLNGMEKYIIAANSPVYIIRRLIGSNDHYLIDIIKNEKIRDNSKVFGFYVSSNENDTFYQNSFILTCDSTKDYYPSKTLDYEDCFKEAKKYFGW